MLLQPNPLPRGATLRNEGGWWVLRFREGGFRKFRTQREARDYISGLSPLENPNGGSAALITGVLVLAAVGITYLMFREKPGKEPEPAPTPPTPTPPAPTPPPPLPSPVCVVTQARFTGWAMDGGKTPIWADKVVGAPPSLAEVKVSFPELANVSGDLIVVATSGGNMIWSYNAAGEPFTNPKIKISLCTWIKEHPGV